MTAHNDLAERIERAEGPDRALDAEIALAVGLDIGRSKAHPQDNRLPAYTGSVDAAMSLLDGVGILMQLSDIGADGLPLARVGCPGLADAPIFTGIASCIMTNTSPVAGLAMALAAAAIRARAQVQPWPIQGSESGRWTA